MLSDKKSSVEKYIEPSIGLFKHVPPHVLTLLGSIPPLLFFVFVIMHWYVLALIAFFCNFFDFIDGMVARKYHKVTTFGSFFDSTLDRISDFFIITAFAFGGIVRWEIVAPLLLFSFLISYARGISEKLAYAKGDTHTKFNIGLIERTERLIMLLAALILFILFPTSSIATFNIAEVILLILVVLSGYTAIQRILYAYKKL